MCKTKENEENKFLQIYLGVLESEKYIYIYIYIYMYFGNFSSSGK